MSDGETHAQLGALDCKIKEVLRDFQVTQVMSFWHTCPRPKMIGKNARCDDHGSQATDFFVRIATNQGVEGLGIGRASQLQIDAMKGRTLDEFWQPQGLISPLGRSDHALYDLIGKALGVPSWRLLGDEGSSWVDVYDSSIYFSDLLPENAEQGVSSVLREVDDALARGHRAFKIKIGRGFQWMPADDGFARDVKVVKSVRKLVGPDVRLMVDSNDSYGIELAKRMFDAVGDELLFAEEMFCEQVEQCLELKSYLRANGIRTMIADGECAPDPAYFEEFIKAGALDVVQPDVSNFGLNLLGHVARRLASTPVKLATHCWGSGLALYPQLLVGRAARNFLIAEQDPAQSTLFDVSAYEFKEGKMRVPDLAGAGVFVREDRFREIYGNVWDQ